MTKLTEYLHTAAAAEYSPKHRQIYRSIRETVSNSSDARLKFSKVKDVARNANISNQEVLGVLSLLSGNPASSSIRAEFRRFDGDRFEPVSDIHVNEMLSLWASEEKAVQSEWTKFARDIEVSWKIDSDDYLGASE